MRAIMLLLLLTGCPGGGGEDKGGPTFDQGVGGEGGAGAAGGAGGEGGAPVGVCGTPHIVYVGAEGGFDPPVVTIRLGDTVEWRLSAPEDTIIPAQLGAEWPGLCDQPRVRDHGDGFDFTGPNALAPSGVFALGPDEVGSVEVDCNSTCVGGEDPFVIAPDLCVCRDGARYASLPSTWASEDVVGVFIRLEWSVIQPDAETFDWSLLDPELDQAVLHGKKFSLAIKAGKAGTPDWIFSTDEDGQPRVDGGGGVTRLSLQDNGSDGDDADCGFTMDLGNPTEQAYEDHYLALLSELATHLKSRADWYQALAYIKPSGANLLSHENRLPKRCTAGCPKCNTRIFAEAGYTPDGLYAFYDAQHARLTELFPDKQISYGLIQAGFPLINNDGDHEQEDGTSTGGPLPGGTEQTSQIVNNGQATYGQRFTVQHNGLAGPPREPNNIVVREGNEDQLTGFQTVNNLATAADLEAALVNLYDNSDAVFVEVYEGDLLQARAQADRILDPTSTGRTLADWTAELTHRRREARFQALGDPYPLVHCHTFTGPALAEPVTLSYFHGALCGTAEVPNEGQIVIEP